MSEVSLQKLHSSVPLYILRFVSAIRQEDRKHYILWVGKDVEDYIRGRFPDFRIAIGWKSRWMRVNRFKTPLHCIFRYKLRCFIVRNHIDCVFIPTDYQWCTSFRFGCRKVIVVHDLKVLKQRVDTWRRAYDVLFLYRMYRKAFKYADQIIAVSKHTRQEIESCYPDYPAERIRVVYNSVVVAEKAHRPRGFQESGYVLYVNTLNEYKNIFTLVRAFAQIKDVFGRQLVVVGRENNYWRTEVLPYIRENGLEGHVLHLQDLTDEELRYLYEHAALFVTPSLNEGFGYTPIEAAICGCPVISSIQDALPDSTRGLLHYYQPATDADALAEKMLHVLQNPPERNALSRIADTYKELYAPARQVEEIQAILLEGEAAGDTPS